jgi:hypothetical protein
MNPKGTVLGRSIMLVILCVTSVMPLWAATVDHRFIITGEVLDFERRADGSVAKRVNNFDTLPPGGGGEHVGTQALVIFATGGLPALSQYEAALPTHHARCMTTDFLTVADDAANLVTLGKPMILDITPVLFGLIAVNPNQNQWVLLDRWSQRLAAFQAHSGGNFNPSTTLFISVNAEVTPGQGPTNNDIDTVVQGVHVPGQPPKLGVKDLFPGVKVAAGYPTGTLQGSSTVSSFPASLDVIVTWDYSIADPRIAPYDSMYAQIKAALHNNQGLYFLVAGFNDDSGFVGPLSEYHKESNNSFTYFGTLLRNWCAFALKQNQAINSGLILWKFDDGYRCGGNNNGSCAAGNCDVTQNTVLTMPGANQTFAYEKSQSNNTLALAYRAVSRAAQFGGIAGSCWQ